MEHVEYFKLQSKNLLRDYKTRIFNKAEEFSDYQPKYFDIGRILFDFNLPDYKKDFKFTLMNAQHIIAQLAGFTKWNDLQNAKSDELELAHLLFDNAHKISAEEWSAYLANAESMNNCRFNSKEKLEIFKQVFLSADKHRSDFIPYRFDLERKHNMPPADLTEDEKYDYKDVYIELNEQEKLAAIKDHQEKGLGYDLEDTVECLHCGKRYQFKEVKAIRLKAEYRSEDDFDEIVCKNYPQCDGNILDLMKVGKNGGLSSEEYDNGHVPFDLDMDQGYVDDYE